MLHVERVNESAPAHDLKAYHTDLATRDVLQALAVGIGTGCALLGAFTAMNFFAEMLDTLIGAI